MLQSYRVSFRSDITQQSRLTSKVKCVSAHIFLSTPFKLLFLALVEIRWKLVSDSSVPAQTTNLSSCAIEAQLRYIAGPEYRLSSENTRSPKNCSLDMTWVNSLLTYPRTAACRSRTGHRALASSSCAHHSTYKHRFSSHFLSVSYATCLPHSLPHLPRSSMLPSQTLSSL